MTEIKLRIVLSFLQTIKEVGNEWERVGILLRDPVECPEIDAEAEGLILFLDKEDQSSVRRGGLADEVGVEILIEEFLKCYLFHCR